MVPRNALADQAADDQAFNRTKDVQEAAYIISLSVVRLRLRDILRCVGEEQARGGSAAATSQAVKVLSTTSKLSYY